MGEVKLVHEDLKVDKFYESDNENKKQLYKNLDRMSYEERYMVKPVARCLHGIGDIGINAGDKVLVLGSGVVGLIMIQLAKLAGASVLGISELIEKKRRVAIELGAICLLNSASNNFDKEIKHYYGEGPDVIIECTGNKYVIEKAINLSKKGSKILLFGIKNSSLKMEVNCETVINKELIIKGPFSKSSIKPEINLEAVNLIAKGHLDIKKIVNNRFELENVLSFLKIQNKFEQKGMIYSIAP